MLSKPKKTMKFNTVVNLLAIAAILSASAVGCKNPQRVTPIPGRGLGQVGDSGASRPLEPGGGTPIDQGVKPTFDPNAPGLPVSEKDLHNWQPAAEQPFRSETVYFDYDKATVKASETAKVENVARGMRNYPGKAVRVAGHCDERGTEEYNRSLGERRALAVREHLARLGVDAQMIHTISFGEDQPAEAAHNDAAWSKNRRAEFILLEPPSGSASTK